MWLCEKLAPERRIGMGHSDISQENQDIEDWMKFKDIKRNGK